MRGPVLSNWLHSGKAPFIHVTPTHKAKAVIFASTSESPVDDGHCNVCQIVGYSISILLMSTRSHHRYRQHLQAPTSADDARRHRNCFGPFRRVIGAGVSTDDTDFLYLLASSVQVSDCAPVRTSVGARRESWMVLFGSVRHVRQSPHRCPSIV